MTDADTPRVPDFRWAPVPQWLGAVYVQSRERWYELAVKPDPVDLPADAVKLGDVEAAEAKLADIRAVLAENYNPNLERWRFPGEVLDLIRAVLDREPGREEPTATPPDRSGRWVDGPPAKRGHR